MLHRTNGWLRVILAVGLLLTAAVVFTACRDDKQRITDHENVLDAEQD
jgi:hypothetical protein